MKYKKILIVLVFIILMFCLIPIRLQSININHFSLKTSQTINTVDYVFNSNSPYTSIDSLDKVNVNLRHNNLITEIYNSTYSFTDEIIDTSGIDIDFIDVDDSVADTGAIIIGTSHYHDKVLELYDDNGAGYANIRHNFSGQTSGTIEFYIKFDDTSFEQRIFINNDTVLGVYIGIYGELLKIRSGGAAYVSTGISILDNIWYHIRIDFECDVGGYKGLASDTYHLYVNFDYINTYGFFAVCVELDNIKFFGASADTESIFIDAYGESWDINYVIGDNKYPNIEQIGSNLLSPDKYEFNLNENSNPYPRVGLQEADFWTRVNVLNYVFLDIPHMSVKTKNVNGINIYSDQDGSATGIKNQSLGLYQDKFNISFGFQITELTEINSYGIFKIYSSNNTEIMRLRFDTQTNTQTKLQYYNGTDYQNLVSIYGIDSTIIYNFNLYIYNFTVGLSWYKNDIYNNTYSFPLIRDLWGINQIHFLGYDETTNTNYLIFRLNYIGIYQYNISLTLEKGYVRYGYMNDWIFTIQNIFDIILSNQSIKILGYEYEYSPTMNYFVFRDFNTTDFLYNLYYRDEILEKAFLFFIPENYINPNTIFFTIGGVKLSEYYNNVFVKEYIPDYSFYNTNINYSYFFVDNLNRLNYKLYLQTNDTLEQISIGFNIDNRLSDNATFFMKGRETITCFGSSFFTIIYTGLVFPTFITLLSYERSFSKVMPSARIFNNFIFTVNDYLTNNNFTDYTSEGYIYDISVVYNYIYIPDLTLALTTLNLMAIIIPLIIILAPTFSIHAVYRKKGAIIPLLIFFSIVAFATSLIPFQIFFLLMIALGSGIFLQYKNQKEVN